MNMQHAYNIALRKNGNKDGYSVFGWHIVNDGYMIISIALEIESNDGGPSTWDEDTDVMIVVHDKDIKEEFDRYERETGKCGECLGTQKVFKSWDHKEGTKYRTCPRCNGSGLKHKQEIMPI